jgi:hypothetical protein
MSEALINNPIGTVNTLLKLHIGDEGRLLYLKNSLKKGKPIFESDKKFLQRMQEVLNKKYKKTASSKPFYISQYVMQKKISEYNNDLNFTSEITAVGQSKNEEKTKQPFEYKNTVNLEKILYEISNSIADLKNTQSKILLDLEYMTNNYKITTNQPNTNKTIHDSFVENNLKSNFENIANSEKITYPKNSKGTSQIKISDLVAWGASGLFVAWFASYLKIIDINPFQNLFLGLSIGLVIYLGIYHKMKK